MEYFGYIYKLSCEDFQDCYIGSSTKTPKQRLNQHLRDMIPSCKHILQSPTLKMDILEYVKDQSSYILWQKEKYYIETIPYCCNKIKPILTAKEVRDDINRRNKQKSETKKKKFWEERARRDLE